ncbi:hypothetical protein ACFL0T_05400 [Candidatus Omnitrophota bacterium]
MIQNAHLAKEIVVTFTNEIGVLANVSDVLSTQGINIEAISGYALNNEATLLLLTSNNAKALAVLQEERYTSAREEEVVVVDMVNKPGTLNKITSKLAIEGIDIYHHYCSVCPSGCPARVVLATSDNERAFLIFKE